MKFNQISKTLGVASFSLLAINLSAFSAKAIEIAGSTNALELANILTAGSAGINITNATLSGHSIGGSVSSGFYSNTVGTYGIGAGVVLSTGDVNDYNTGPNTSGSNTTGYGVAATPAQEALLDPITGGGFSHFDVTQLDIFFDTADTEQIAFNVVFGSEEWPEFVNTSFIDGFGLFTGFVNGVPVNIAQVNGLPVNINHPDMMGLLGTQLDGVLAPGGNPLLTFIADVPANTPNQVFTFLVADTSDSAYDTTVYLSQFTGEGGSEFLPFLPEVDPEQPGVFTFNDAPSGIWFDPPFADGFDYTIDPADTDSFFTAIQLPTSATVPDADGLFDLFVGNTQVGTYASGASVNFANAGFLNVTQFSVEGIDPQVDAAFADAFPLFIEFNTQTGNNFSQVAIVNNNGGGGATTPEPTSIISLFGLGLLGFASSRKKAN